MPEWRASDGVRLHYREAGTGRPLVFVHGWTMSGAFFGPQFERLADRYRCIAPDLRGCGDSESRAGTHTMARLAQDVHELLSGLDLRDVVLVGWSMGGGITMHYLDRYGPARLSGVGLIDFPPRFEEDPAVVDRVCERIRTDRDRFFLSFAKRMFHAEPEPAIVEWLLRENRKCTTDTACELYRQLGVGSSVGKRYELPAFLAFPERGWYVNTLAAWGEIFPRHTAPGFRASRHAPFLEEPDRFAAALRDFADAAGAG